MKEDVTAEEYLETLVELQLSLLPEKEYIGFEVYVSEKKDKGHAR